jgi:hypothetical protein
MFYCGGGGKGFVRVSNGLSNGRSFWEEVTNGKLTMKGLNSEHQLFERKVEFREGQVWDNKLKIEGKPTYHIIYGKFEKLGKTSVSFKQGSGQSKHGKARRAEKLGGHEGVCHSWYKNGRLIRQKFIYDNGKHAYNYNACGNVCTIKDYDGNVLFEVKGYLSGKIDNAMYEGHSVFGRPMEDWFNYSKPFEVIKKGKTFYKGEVKDRQRVGEWFIDGKEYCYVKGVEIPKKLFNTPPDKLDPLAILKLPNAQARMALMSKIDPKRIADCGKVVHKDGDMRLYAIKNLEVKILRVRCTTTKAYYYLRVPKDSKQCEQARQWTFGVGENFDKPIKFEVET